MSTLNEEVARLKQAKTNIAAAITGKGVEIPAGSLLDTYGDYIHQIEVGSTVEGVTSANVTAKRSDVAKGVTTVTSDSYDEIVEGTLELVGTATEEKVLIGESFYNNNLYEKSTGTMPNNGSVTAILNAGESYKVPLGYHDGEGLIQAADLQSQTQGTATVEKILIGETAVVNGEPLTGTMPNNGAVAPEALAAGDSYTIPEGYHNGSGKVTVQTLATLTSAGDATAAQILSGKKAYVDGSLITGTMTNRGAQTKSFTPSTSAQTYTIPSGYHNGSGKVTVAAIPSKYIDSTANQVSF